MTAPNSDRSVTKQTPEQAQNVFRTVAAAQHAISVAERSREVARSTRLRFKLDSIAKQCRNCPPRTSGAVTRVLEDVLDAVMGSAEATMGNLQLLENETGTLRIRVQRKSAAARVP